MLGCSFFPAYSNDEESEYEEDDGAGHQSFVDGNSENGPAMSLGRSIKSKCNSIKALSMHVQACDCISDYKKFTLFWVMFCVLTSFYTLYVHITHTNPDIHTHKTDCRKKEPYQYLSMGKRAVPADNHTVVGRLKTASPRNSSSASNHDSSGQNNKAESTSTSTTSDGSSSDSDSSGTAHSSEHPYNGELYQSASELLTEDAVRQHNAEYEPMNSRERIRFWRISEEFNDIEDDFDEKTNFSKPIRSERVSTIHEK